MRYPSVGLFLLCAASAPAIAHHSIAAMYDRENPVTIEGTVTRFDYINPHPVIHLDVAGVAWTVEWSNLRRLESRGYTADALKAGDRIIVTGGPARDGTKALFVGQLRRPSDGFEFISTLGVPAR